MDQGWASSFGEKIKIYGFDPVVDEIKRLNNQNTNPNTQFIEGFVISNSEFKSPVVEFSNRLSMGAANAIVKNAETYFNIHGDNFLSAIIGTINFI